MMCLTEEVRQMDYGAHRNSHSIGWSIHHLEWCTKYRYKIFRKEKLKQLILQIITCIVEQYKIKIEEIDIEPEHIHIIVNIPSMMSVGKALQLLKGISSKRMFELCPKLKLRYPNGHLWSKGKFNGSVGHISLAVAKEYVKNNEAHHAITQLILARSA